MSPHWQSGLRKLTERRDLATQARDRALATIAAPLDIDPAAIEAMTRDLPRAADHRRRVGPQGMALGGGGPHHRLRGQNQGLWSEVDFQPPVKPGPSGGSSVRTSVQEWCRKRDSNPPTPSLRMRCSTS